MEPIPQRAHAKNNEWLIPLAIFLISLTVRVIGIKFSFPLLTHHDEQYIMNPLVEMSRNHTLDSGHYNRPNQVLYTLLFIVLNGLGKLVFHKNFGWAYADDPLFFYFYARLCIAIIGALIPVLAWKIGKLIKGVDFSVPAAALTCFYPSYVVHSHYLTSDVIITFFSYAVLMLCLLYLADNKRVWLYLACVCTALSTMEKYPSILLYGFLLVTLGISAFRSKPPAWKALLRDVMLTLLIILLGMILIAPHLLSKLPQIRELLILEARTTHLGADGLSWAGNMLFYLQTFIETAGWWVVLLVVVGILVSIVSRQPEMLLLYFGAGYWVSLSKLGLHWERWSLPMMLTPLLLAGLGTAKVWDKLKQKRYLNILTASALTLVFLIFALNGLTSSVLMTWQDTRVDALQFLNENGITEENAAFEGYTPFLPRTVQTIFDFDLDNPGQTRYIILSSNMYGRFAAEPDRYLEENAFYANLREHAVKIAEFTPSSKPSNLSQKLRVISEYLQRLRDRSKPAFTTGPTIQVFRLP